MIKCYYHCSDFDGKMSAAIVKYFLPQAKLIPFDYHHKISSDDFDENDEIFFVDCSPQPYELIVDIWRRIKSHGSLTVIDHHKSFIESDGVKFLLELNCANLNLKLDVNFAACELTWMYFSNDEMPPAVELLGIYDSWRDSLGPFWATDVLPFQYGLRAANPDVLDLHKYFDKDLYHEIEMGKHILKYQDSINTMSAKKTFEFTMIFNNKRYVLLCLNTQQRNSNVFAKKFDEKKHDFMVAFSMNEKMKWSYSIYTTKESLDCSEIAKSLGGGGHKKAAGFYTDRLIFQNDEIILIS